MVRFLYAHTCNSTRYSKYGVTVGPGGYGGYGKHGGAWWPPAGGKLAWGMAGDGVCHMERTRSGGAAVHSRNWHPGPQGHQTMADKWAFLYVQLELVFNTDILLLFVCMNSCESVERELVVIMCFLLLLLSELITVI